MSADLTALEEAHLQARERLRVCEEALFLAQKEVEAHLHFQLAEARDVARKLLGIVERRVPVSKAPGRCRAQWDWLNEEDEPEEPR